MINEKHMEQNVRRKDEQNLKMVFNSREKLADNYENLCDFFPSPVLLYDCKTQAIVYINHALSTLLGYESLQGSTIISEKEYELLAANILHSLSNGPSHSFELRIRDKKGKPYLFKSSARLLPATDDKEAHLVLISAEDITPYINLQKDLMVANESAKNNKNNDKELEEFAYIASHDLQEPLRKITIFSSKLYSNFHEALGEEGKMYLERMNVSANNMRNLIESLLKFSRTANNTQPFVKTNLNEIIRQAEESLELKIEEARADVVAADLPVIEAVPSQMAQLFNNLLSNSVKFRTPGFRPCINITCNVLTEQKRNEYRLPEKKYYLIQVKDNGIGFEQEHADKVFQLFTRLHGKTEYPGSGIGLAICKKIVDKHQGRIYAESVPEKGATFTIILPENQ